MAIPDLRAHALAALSLLSMHGCRGAAMASSAPSEPTYSYFEPEPQVAAPFVPERVVDNPVGFDIPPGLDLRLQEAESQSAPRYSDPNQRPIHVRVVGGEGLVDAIYVVGHADGECCPLVSGVIHDAALIAGLDENFFSFGVGHLSARNDPARGRLARAARELAQIADRPQCRGQVRFTRSATDTVAGDLAAVLDTAALAHAAAARSQRAVVLWYELSPDSMVLAPLLVPDARGALTPLRIRLPESAFAFPRSLLDHLSIDGTGQYIASLKQAIAIRHAARKLPKDPLGRPRLVTGVRLVETGYATNYRAPQIMREISANLDAATRAIADIEAQRDFSSRLASAVTQAMMQESERVLGPLRRAHTRNQTAMAELRRVPERAVTDAKTEIHFTEVEPRYALLEELVPDFTQLAALNLSDLERALAAAEASARAPRTDPWIPLVDAGLRGWPATFSTARAEKDFDRWVASRQVGLWREIDARLRSDGVQLGQPGDAVRVLQTSNLVFRVEHGGGEVTIEPILVLSGPFYLVADPAARIVRYESVIADQNLASL